MGVWLPEEWPVDTEIPDLKLQRGSWIQNNQVTVFIKDMNFLHILSHWTITNWILRLCQRRASSVQTEQNTPELCASRSRCLFHVRFWKLSYAFIKSQLILGWEDRGSCRFCFSWWLTDPQKLKQSVIQLFRGGLFTGQGDGHIQVQGMWFHRVVTVCSGVTTSLPFSPCSGRRSACDATSHVCFFSPSFQTILLFHKRV